MFNVQGLLTFVCLFSENITVKLSKKSQSHFISDFFFHMSLFFLNNASNKTTTLNSCIDLVNKIFVYPKTTLLTALIDKEVTTIPIHLPRE
jgi:hypothetical protein